LVGAKKSIRADGFAPCDNGQSDSEDEYKFDIFAESTSEKGTEGDKDASKVSYEDNENSGVDKELQVPIHPNIVSRKMFKAYGKHDNFANGVYCSQGETGIKNLEF
jgi:hypothetical protein